MAQTEEEQRFANLNEKVSAVDIHCEREVGLAREELQLKHQELGQAHEELKTEVAELRKRLSAKESTLHVTAPEFTSAPSFISAGSISTPGDHHDSPRSQQHPPTL